MRKKVIFSCLTLLLGILIYILSRNQLLIKQDLVSSFIRNYIPDCLWAISFYSISSIFLKQLTKYYIVLTAIYVIIIGLFFELLQFTGKVRGTFDVFDIIVYIVSALIACLIEKYYWGDKI